MQGCGSGSGCFGRIQFRSLKFCRIPLRSNFSCSIFFTKVTNQYLISIILTFMSKEKVKIRSGWLFEGWVRTRVKSTRIHNPGSMALAGFRIPVYLIWSICGHNSKPNPNSTEKKISLHSSCFSSCTQKCYVFFATCKKYITSVIETL